LSGSIVQSPRTHEIAESVKHKVFEDHIDYEDFVTGITVGVERIDEYRTWTHQAATKHHAIEETANVDIDAILDCPAVPDDSWGEYWDT
jgi:hypothetical protein